MALHDDGGVLHRAARYGRRTESVFEPVQRLMIAESKPVEMVNSADLGCARKVRARTQEAFAREEVKCGVP